MNLQAKISLGVYFSIIGSLVYISKIWEDGPWFRRQCRNSVKVCKKAGKAAARYAVEAELLPQHLCRREKHEEIVTVRIRPEMEGKI